MKLFFTFLITALSTSLTISLDLLNKTTTQKTPLKNLLKTLNSNELTFNLKLVNVDSTSAQFELTDDNSTTINYIISYSIKTKGKPDSSIFKTKKFEMQTNSRVLINQQEELLKSQAAAPSVDNNLLAGLSDSGEKYDSEEKLSIESKSWTDVHRFLVAELESDRLYEIDFDITAKQAYLSASLTGNLLHRIKLKEGKATFNFEFQTTFDIDKAIVQACNINSDKAASNQTCYARENDCTKCKPVCYKRELNRIVGVSVDSVKKTSDDVSKSILCEPCPCDQSKSTGECVVVARNADDLAKNNFQPDVIKCKQCIIPYTGDQCNECEKEGIDNYKSEMGLCVKCECNGNAAWDQANVDERDNGVKRKCKAVSGMCIDCQFNTTGKHCNECATGYIGNALTKTCHPDPDLKTKSSNNTSQTNPTTTTKVTHTPNNDKTYPKHPHLMLFSIYIFCIIGIILFAYFCVSYQSRHSGILKDVNLSGSSLCAFSNLFSARTYTNMFNNLKESTRNQRSRISFYLASICPCNLSMLTRTNLSSGTNVNNTNGGLIYTGGSTYGLDDDRLNLAEYQVFDEGLLNDENNVYIYRNPTSGSGAGSGDIQNQLSSENEDSAHKSSNKNPYRSLTIKS